MDGAQSSERQMQIPFDYAQGRLSTHHARLKSFWNPVRSGMTGRWGDWERSNDDASFLRHHAGFQLSAFSFWGLRAPAVGQRALARGACRRLVGPASRQGLSAFRLRDLMG